MARIQRLLATVDLCRYYKLAGEDITALKDVNLNVFPGQFIAVVGRSGSGKTTLLNLLAGLDKPSSGQILLEEKNMAEMNESELTQVRRKKLGFVFQSFGLLPLLSALENVELPLRIGGVGAKERDERTQEALEIVGLTRRSHHRPYELSGGEQQRVAIARAIVHKPVLILADEPTGELDSVNAHSIFGLFKEMVRGQGISVVAATHDSTLLAMADQVLELHDGRLSQREHETHRYRD
ncbi:MAG: ABC transporter ATP-binding protein [SAR202 cluster bacterium]|nr:ABC transporter ATP-binding protein [SAR202 cluster bacterium]